VIIDLSERKCVLHDLWSGTNIRYYGCNLELLSYLEQTHEKKKDMERLKALGSLASGIAHEFTNILVVILGNSQLLQMKLRDNEITKFVSEIATAAGDAAQIVRRIQTYSRPHTKSERKKLQVNGVIASALEFTRTKWDNEAVVNG
jgi:signal transduction histidine kinase